MYPVVVPSSQCGLIAASMLRVTTSGTSDIGIPVVRAPPDTCQVLGQLSSVFLRDRSDGSSNISPTDVLICVHQNFSSIDITICKRSTLSISSDLQSDFLRITLDDAP